MADRFKHVALVGKTQAHGFRPVLEEVAQFLLGLGLEVSVEAATAQTNGLTGYDALPEALGRDCDVAVVVGGDGTMLGFARQMASYGIPLVGINQGRLGFITDIQERYREVPRPSRPAPTRSSRAACSKAGCCAVARSSTPVWRSMTWLSAGAVTPAWSSCASTWATSVANMRPMA